MKRFLFITTFLLLLPQFAFAHVGSPNIFFEGNAGSVPVRVILRPPAVLPGIVQADVRINASNVTNVFVQVVPWEKTATAAPPVTAIAVAGEANLFNAAFWLLYSGSYSVRITVEGTRGSGTVIIPLNSAATQKPSVSPTFLVALTAAGIILFLAAVFLTRATARDGTLEIGTTPTDADHSRARRAGIIAASILAIAACATTLRWRVMDREFRNNALYKPLPVVATIRTNGALHLLHLSPPIENRGALTWDTLVADHGKLMHLFLLREPDFAAFAHLHPVRRDAEVFENVLPSLPSGDYQLYAELTHENGLSETLTAKVSVPISFGNAPQAKGSTTVNEVFCQSIPAPVGDSPQPFALDADDSWHVSPSASSRVKVSPLMRGAFMTFQNAEELVENRETSLRFAVCDADGKPAALLPYMGMLGHAVIRRNDGAVFTHLHPLGTISMAAEEILKSREQSLTAETNTVRAIVQNSSTINVVTFPYAFPRPGEYRLWIQVRTLGQVLTGVFDVTVKMAR